MKKVRLFLTLLFLMVASAVVLTSRMTPPRGIIQLKSETHFPEIMKSTTFNDTLLRYASIDLAEPRLDKEIEDLLNGDFRHSGGSRHRSFLSSRRNNRFDVRARSARGLPVEHQSPEFHRIWLRFQRVLHDWSRKRRFQDDVMLDLMNNANLGLKTKYRSCAVVGNSGILLKTEFGGLIDDHEVVIRLNNARIGSFAKNVGKKTTISFVNSNILHLCARRETCFCHPYGLNVPIAMYICQPAHLLDYLVCSNTSHRAPLIYTNPSFDILCARIAKYYSMKRFILLSGKEFEDWGPAHDEINFHYSSGMQAVMLAVGICEKVSIFGFGKSSDAKHHYHTNQKAELGLHDYEAEFDLYRDLVSNPEIIPFISDKFKFPPVAIYH